MQIHTVKHRKLKLGMLNPPIGAVVIGYKALTSMASEAGGGHSTLGSKNSQKESFFGGSALHQRRSGTGSEPDVTGNKPEVTGN